MHKAHVIGSKINQSEGWLTKNKTMKGQLATGFVPYEIGDKVKLKNGDTIWKVTEIRLTQYVAEKKAEIHLQLLDEYDGTKIWRYPDRVEKRVGG